MHILMDNSVWIAYFEACLHHHYRTGKNQANRTQLPKQQTPTNNIQTTSIAPVIKVNNENKPLIAAGSLQSPEKLSLVNAHHNNDELLLIETVDFLSSEKMLVTNDVVLAELTPYMQSRFTGSEKENKTAKLSETGRISDVMGFTTPFSFNTEQSPQIMNMPLAIDWEEIARFHSQCAQAQMNNINLTDLLVTQSALQNQLRVFSFKPHFQSLQQLLGVDMLQYGYSE